MEENSYYEINTVNRVAGFGTMLSSANFRITQENQTIVARH